jgi:hypothetical protein
MPNHAASTKGFVSVEAAGKLKWNVAPRPSWDVAHSLPPCDSTMERLIASPMPLPWGFVVKKALNISSAPPAGNPTPVSLTEIST